MDSIYVAFTLLTVSFYCESTEVARAESFALERNLTSIHQRSPNNSAEHHQITDFKVSPDVENGNGIYGTKIPEIESTLDFTPLSEISTENFDVDDNSHSRRSAPGRLGDCRKCMWQDCPSVDIMRQHCPSGVVRDRCKCCVTCASGEGMPCYLTGTTAAEWIPPCGDDLQCVPFTENDDLDIDLESWGGRKDLEGQCACLEQAPVCGSNNVTYKNTCRFREIVARQSATNETLLVFAYYGPCNARPVIDEAPKDVTVKLGDTVSFRCEASGFPVPRLQWFKKTSESNSIDRNFDFNDDVIELPGYLTHAVTQVRGGPAKYQLTTWLTLDGVGSQDRGTYLCRASNNYGAVDGCALLTITRP